MSTKDRSIHPVLQFFDISKTVCHNVYECLEQADERQAVGKDRVGGQVSQQRRGDRSLNEKHLGSARGVSCNSICKEQQIHSKVTRLVFIFFLSPRANLPKFFFFFPLPLFRLFICGDMIWALCRLWSLVWIRYCKITPHHL